MNMEVSYDSIKKDISVFNRPKVVFYGKGNSPLCKKLILMAAHYKFDLSVKSAIFCFPEHAFMEKAEEDATKNGTTLIITTSFEEAIKHASLIYTESEKETDKLTEEFDFVVKGKVINA